MAYLNYLIFTTVQSKRVSTEHFIKCGDPGKYNFINWGSCFEPEVTWNKHVEDKNIMVIIYEDLKENLTASVKQISALLGFSPTAKQIQTIAGRHTFQPGNVKAQDTHGLLA
ncbi:LOW QUALITY PROTEIN: sulfotransferase 6B1 [Geothlypis trichas]